MVVIINGDHLLPLAHRSDLLNHQRGQEVREEILSIQIEIGSPEHSLGRRVQQSALFPTETFPTAGQSAERVPIAFWLASIENGQGFILTF